MNNLLLLTFTLFNVSIKQSDDIYNNIIQQSKDFYSKNNITHINDINNSDMHIIQKNETKCIMCKDLVNLILMEEHKVNSTIVSIINLIKAVCNDIKGPNAEECRVIIDNIQYIIKLIGEGLSAESICQLIKFC